MLKSHGCCQAIIRSRRAKVFCSALSIIAPRFNLQVRQQQQQQRQLKVSSYYHGGGRSSKAVQHDAVDTQPLGESSLPMTLEPLYPVVLAQVRSNMHKFENCVILTRVGGFYELYFEHAEEFGPRLNLKVATKQTTNGPVAMVCHNSTCKHSPTNELPQSGFPFMQLDKFLKILVQDLNQYVAIAEEFPNDTVAKIKSGGNLFDRRVTRVVTPGTLIDENFMDPYANNYILAVDVRDNGAANEIDKPIEPTNVKSLATIAVGVAWLDLSTGQFQTQSTTVSMLGAVVSRIRPRELILDQALKDLPDEHPIVAALVEDERLITFTSDHNEALDAEFDLATGNPRLMKELIWGDSKNPFTQEEKAAGVRLLRYIDTRLLGTNSELQRPVRYSTEENMIIDKNTMRALELKQTLRESGSSKGTLLHAIRRTITKSGARLLEERLCEFRIIFKAIHINTLLAAPSTSLGIINERLDLVDYMYKNRLVAERIRSLLKRSDDSRRLAQKFAYGRGTADDLIALNNTILATEQLREYFESCIFRPEAGPTNCIRLLTDRITLAGPQRLAERIRSAIDEEGVTELHRTEADSASSVANLAEQLAINEGSQPDIQTFSRRAKKKKQKPTSIREHYANEGDVWMMKPAASPGLETLHLQLNALDEQKLVLTQSLQERVGVTTLSLRWTPGLGHICHIRARAKEKPNVSEIIAVSSSKSTQSFHHPEWTTLGREIDHVKLRIRSEESAVFSNLRQEVVLNLFKIRQNAAVLDELDIACSFAELAWEQNLTRPILNDGTGHKIIGGRHPTVQDGLQEQGQSFISNDCFVGSPSRLWFITGPNMAGKSTFLRQNALITIMAQIGSFVPADFAEIGIVDQIFSRVGSADNLFRNQSTFMVEMLESATILKQATTKSFVIMDEIGRGTTPEDGSAVAFACMHHLYHTNQCRTLFATHFHELADRAKKMKSVDYYCTDVIEDGDGGFGYVHKLRKGINRNSHALKVARIAGLPEAALLVAQDLLSGKTIV